MKRIILFALALTTALLLYAQQQRGTCAPHAPFEVLSVFPHETPPGFYSKVDQRELQNQPEQGWELAGVTPYIYRNEDRGSNNPKAVVTQTYTAYFFKRYRVIR